MTVKEKLMPIAEPGSETPTPAEQWALVEVKGYRGLTGIVGEATLADHKFVSVDVPLRNGSFERFLIEPGSIHMISPVDPPTTRKLGAADEREAFHLTSGAAVDEEDSSEATATPFPFIPDECE